jgi:hypothetical protein
VYKRSIVICTRSRISSLERRAVLWSAILFCAIVVLSAGCGQSEAQRRAELQQEGAGIAARGLMSADDWVTLRQIDDRVYKTRTISDGDLDWILKRMQRPPLDTADPNNAPMMRRGALEYVLLLKNIPATQEDRIYIATAPLLSSGNLLDKLEGIRVMTVLRDKRAIPQVVKLLSDPDKRVRNHAKELLRIIGDPVPSARRGAGAREFRGLHI